MPVIIQKNDSNKIWSAVYSKLIRSNNHVDSRFGETIELSQVLLTLNNPRQRWISTRVPTISIAFAIAEVVWILNKSNESRIINFWNPSLSRFSGKGKYYHGAYGYRIGHEFGIDQLNTAYLALKSNPTTRQVVIQYYKPDIDLPSSDGSPKSTDIPCNVSSIIKIRDSKLEWTQIMRSNDAIYGLPYNIVQFTCLQEILAGWLDCDIGKYTHFTDSLHIYNKDISKYKAFKGTHLINNDMIRVNKRESDILFSEMYSRMTCIVNKSSIITEEELEKLSLLKSEHVCLNNMMLIIGAYAANKFKYANLINKLLELCSNHLYVFLMKKWIDRQSVIVSV